MANTRSAAKAARVAQRRARRNRSVRTFTRGRVRLTEQMISSGNVEEAQRLFVEATRALDRAQKKGVIHPGNAARRKSRLAKKLNRALATATGEG